MKDLPGQRRSHDFAGLMRGLAGREGAGRRGGDPALRLLGCRLEEGLRRALATGGGRSASAPAGDEDGAKVVDVGEGRSGAQQRAGGGEHAQGIVRRQ